MTKYIEAARITVGILVAVTGRVIERAGATIAGGGR